MKWYDLEDPVIYNIEKNPFKWFDWNEEDYHHSEWLQVFARFHMQMRWKKQKVTKKHQKKKKKKKKSDSKFKWYIGCSRGWSWWRLLIRMFLCLTAGCGVVGPADNSTLSIIDKDVTVISMILHFSILCFIRHLLCLAFHLYFPTAPLIFQTLLRISSSWSSLTSAPPFQIFIPTDSLQTAREKARLNINWKYVNN